MTVLLGLDIGSNSVGSAWVDTEKREIRMGVSVFPAGVDEQENKRGAPKNQARRQARSQRRTIARRAERKRKLIRFLMEKSLLPRDSDGLRKLFDLDPWELRRKALSEPLSLHEFGRVVVHLAQRRGAVGVVTDPDDPDEGKVKEGMDRLARFMKDRGAQTVGHLVAGLIDERREPIERLPDDRCSRRTLQRRRQRQGRELADPQVTPVRNRQYRIREEDMLFAGRPLISAEFHRIVENQRNQEGAPLAPILTKELVDALDDARQTSTWRHQGLLFGQRRTYWDTGTLGRCDLEPTERCVPIADRHASYYRVVETVNNILIEKSGRPPWLTFDERKKVIEKLRGQLFKKSKGKLVSKSSASVTDIKEALGIAPRDKSVRLNIESDEDRDINTDWFYREIVHGAFTEARWLTMTEPQRESVNRAILKFNPDHEDDAKKLRAGAISWWGLDEAGADRLIEAWKERPKLEKRLNLSRKAVINLLPRMEEFDAHSNRWPTQQEARKAYARVLDALYQKSGVEADRIAAERYATGALGMTAADRYYMRLEKHQIEKGVPELPPAPMLSNPVVRKAIHEVRRHLLAYLRKFRRKPDRVVIEFARGVKDTAKRRNEQLAANRAREKERKLIEEKLKDWGIPESNWKAATLRVRLCQEQKGVCPFSLRGDNANRTITEKMAAEGRDVEIEHIVPEGLSGKTMAFNNLVLCYREANRGKSMRTPLDWLGAEGVKTMLQRLENAPIKANRVKWERLQLATPDEASFRNSQLTDTAYAARQVAAYIADALYEGRGLPERGGQRKIFTTKGEYTARLRADWGLHESTLDRAHRLEAPPSPEDLRGDPHLEQSTRRARKEPKDRKDHRHHAIDALAIAMIGPELVTEAGRVAREAREHWERTSHWARRKPLPYPAAWSTPEAFHQDVFRAFEELKVSHRAIKRRIVGSFHDAEHYGPVFAPIPAHRTESAETLFTNRISADEITPNHLRVPEGWDEASARLDDPNVSGVERKMIRRQLATMTDPKPEKSGIIRDRTLRDRIRKCIRANALDPDDRRKKGNAFLLSTEIKRLRESGRLNMASGVPIKGAILLRTITDAVKIPRKRWDPMANRMILDRDPRAARVYIGGNNHHLEIRQAKKSGKWSGEVVPAHKAARINAKRLEAVSDALRAAGAPRGKKWRQLSKPERRKYAPIIASAEAQFPVVNRCDDDQSTFVMSLAEGEMVYACRKDCPEESPNYFVVCKIDPSGRVHFAPHWDARKASEQDRWDVTPADLKNCGPVPLQPPYKVRVSPLGEVRKLERD